jgi:aspartate carbamoyltransferase catalytic subunit
MLYTFKGDLTADNSIWVLEDMPAFPHLTATSQLEREFIEDRLFPLCEILRNVDAADGRLSGLALYSLFYEPSLLTKTSFERAMGLLGGQIYGTEDASQFFPVSNASHMDNIIKILASMRIDVVVLRSSSPGVVERAEFADALAVINGGSADDHPTQAIADLYTLHRELGGVGGLKIAVVGRLEHRNVNALLRGLALFDSVCVTLIPVSGGVDPDVLSHCRHRGMSVSVESDLEAVASADAIYLNAPRTLAHAQLLRSRGAFSLRIDGDFMVKLKPHCIIMDPMQRSGDFVVEVEDDRLAFYRQSENALVMRMAILANMFDRC